MGLSSEYHYRLALREPDTLRVDGSADGNSKQTVETVSKQSAHRFYCWAQAIVTRTHKPRRTRINLAKSAFCT